MLKRVCFVSADKHPEDAVSNNLDTDIRVLPSPDHPTRLALLLAYRQGLRTSPAVAWNMALAIARERFPLMSDHQLGRMLLFALGFYESPSDRKASKKGPSP